MTTADHTDASGSDSAGAVPIDGSAPDDDGRDGRQRLVDGPADADAARLLFRYVSVEEWRDYRAIMTVLAGTFFAEFSPTDVAAELRSAGRHLDVATVGGRLESLRQWGNVAVSSSVGNPASLEDYYRRRHRYLVTRHGQEVHDLVEGMLTRVDEVGDLQAGRLRDLRRALQRLLELVDPEDGSTSGTAASATDIAEVVRGVFDPHRAFTTEITQFFAALNQWQSRYDLDVDQVQFFAQVLVGYVSEQLAEIRTTSRPIAQQLRRLDPHLGQIVAAADRGLAGRVDDAGLGGTISVTRTAGATIGDWEHLRGWFSAERSERSRLDALTHQALSAVSTLTTNLTRLSRVGGTATSRRADFVQLAQWFHQASDADAAHDLAAAAFGLFPSRHLGMLGSDADDPVASSTAWSSSDAPRAIVPVAVRERGEATMRGRASPIRDRSAQREHLRLLRQRELDAARRAAAEVLDACGPDGRLDGAHLSAPAFVAVRDLLGKAASQRRGVEVRRSASERHLQIDVVRLVGTTTTIAGPDGVLRLLDTEVRCAPHGAPSSGTGSSVTQGRDVESGDDDALSVGDWGER